jgi:hypothetical protein
MYVISVFNYLNGGSLFHYKFFIGSFSYFCVKLVFKISIKLFIKNLKIAVNTIAL